MAKTDKELAVELANTYIAAWFSRPVQTLKPLSGEDLAKLVAGAYDAIHSLPEE